MHKLKLDPGEADEFYQLEHIPIETQEHDPLYDDKRTLAHDFVVFKLKWASQLYADQIVGLDSPDDGFELSVGDELVVMGFGLDYNVLQEATVQYALIEQCSLVYSESYSQDEIICTTRTAGDVNPICVVSFVPFCPFISCLVLSLT
mgnify:CR=1 FL=1